ncbi:hypothetical protein L7F22_035394 [Adiantum nelumboides]|nr:hypothetical protein [Adiantum nelumboides]
MSMNFEASWDYVLITGDPERDDDYGTSSDSAGLAEIIRRDGLASKVQEEDDLYTSVVIATTRSNRLVKSRRWVADGLKELKNAKQSKRSLATPDICSESAVDLSSNKLFEALVHTDIGQDRQNIETVYVRTRRKTPTSVESFKVNKAQRGLEGDWLCGSVVDSVQSDSQDISGQHESSTDLTDWEEFFSSGDYCFNDLPMDQPSLDIPIPNEPSICANFYSRRKKRESTHKNSIRDCTENVTAEQNIEEQNLCASAEGSQSPRTSLRGSKTLCGLLGGVAS